MRAGREDPLLGCRLPAWQFGGPDGPHPAAAAVSAAAPDGDTLAVVFDAFESGVTAEPATPPGAMLHPARGIDDESVACPRSCSGSEAASGMERARMHPGTVLPGNGIPNRQPLEVQVVRQQSCNMERADIRLWWVTR